MKFKFKQSPQKFLGTPSPIVQDSINVGDSELSYKFFEFKKAYTEKYPLIERAKQRKVLGKDMMTFIIGKVWKSKKYNNNDMVANMNMGLLLTIPDACFKRMPDGTINVRLKLLTNKNYNPLTDDNSNDYWIICEAPKEVDESQHLKQMKEERRKDIVEKIKSGGYANISQEALIELLDKYKNG